VWSPYHARLIRRIESVLRKFTKRLPGNIGDVEYRDRLLCLGIDSLEVARLRQDLVNVYKVVFGLVGHACDGLCQLANILHSPYTRGHPYKLYSH
jgi:hypothetical protein